MKWLHTNVWAGGPCLMFETWECRILQCRKALSATSSAGVSISLCLGCYHRFEHLGSTAARQLFEHSFETMRTRYDFVVSAYVVMPDHPHLFVSEPKNVQLPKVIQALKLSVSV